MKKKQRDDGENPEEELPVEPSGDSFGTWLRRQREGREIDLREIADASKIGLRYLQAFEEDRFDILPAPIFAKGFLRQYARYVGLDPEEVVNFYLSACQEVDAEDSSLGPVRPPQRQPRSTWLLLVGAVLLIVLFWWLLHKEERSALRETEPESSGPAEVVTPPNVEEFDPASELSENVGPAEEAALAADDMASTDGANGVAAEDVSAAEDESAIRIVLDFSGDCWIEASTDGVKRLAATKVQGESMILDAEELVELKIGDVQAVQLSVNEQPFALTPRRGSTVLDVSIDLETIANLESGRAGSNSTE